MTESGQRQCITSLTAKKDKWHYGNPSQLDVTFVAMNALVNVLVDEVLILQCHDNGDSQEPDDRHPERSRVWSELLQSADGSQSERSHGPSSTVARMMMNHALAYSIHFVPWYAESPQTHLKCFLLVVWSLRAFRKKTSFSLVCINVLHQVDQKALSISALKSG